MSDRDYDYYDEFYDDYYTWDVEQGLVSKSTGGSGNASLWIATICFGFTFAGILLQICGIEISEISDGAYTALFVIGCIISYAVIKRLTTGGNNAKKADPVSSKSENTKALNNTPSGNRAVTDVQRNSRVQRPIVQKRSNDPVWGDPQMQAWKEKLVAEDKQKKKAYIEEHRKLVEWVSNRDKQS